MPDQPRGSLSQADDAVITVAAETLGGHSKKGLLARIMPFFGPAFIASIAYVDPGNFATNIQAGAQYGYLLVWVIVASNLMAMLIQTLSAKLGIATGKNLAECCREKYPKPVTVSLWLLMELVAMATDLAEFLGAALGMYLLFGIPLVWAGIITGIATFLILTMERFGFRPLEAIISAFVGSIALCYLIEMWIGHPDGAQIIHSIIRPRFAGTESILLACGILGATVMPHVIFLHSALTAGRIVVKEPEMRRKLMRFQVMDVVLAMSVAGLVNMAMLVTAAAAFHSSGHQNVGTIEKAYLALTPLLGPAASWVFGGALLAAGLSSSAVGTMSGQVIMQGFMKTHIAPWLRRLITMLPALLVIMFGADPTRTLVISQVLLSFGLPFAIIPLVLFTADKKLMGDLVNRPFITALASVVAALIVVLNLFLLFETVKGLFA